ncbi:MAG TPA: hypothetical protein VNW92_23480 [Polyangiaceae bacterium]|jgi:hypothetical protein|nr:hypothetical protein [Polyangiaceae bacterium]
MTKRWESPPDRWENLEEPQAAADAFLSTAYRLIGRKRPSEDWSEVERLGMRLATRLQTAFQFVPDDSYVWVLRRALDAFDRQPTMESSRAWSVRAVAEWGERWNHPDWQATEETRRKLVAQLVSELCLHDVAFEELRGDSAFLIELLGAFDPEPAGKAGRKGAERILAEIILRVGADTVLGLKDDMAQEPELAVETIRKKLVKAGDEYKKRAELDAK